MISIFKILLNMAFYVTRRGKGIFKFLFVIDDFIRLFTMTLLIPIAFSWLGFSSIFVNAGVVLGLVIDFHDFIAEFGAGQNEFKPYL